ncbi:integral membrane protein [Paraphaeosphaeria minitans]|uniref:Integral membrane protein n=1 Tax=Paraphaeosphaeria minitans TaxID=565426 RepID=A0A9P6GP29_9PLEO|nr:integral membrane protein [Paraphaeosphaeria minitans]
MSAASTEALPLNNRSSDLKISVVTLIVFSSIFVFLRLYVSWRNRNFFQATDHFLWTGHLLAMIAAIFTYKTADVGAGKHVWDPSQTPDHLEKYLKWLWFSQLFNLYGMALIKLSICAYILMLDFTKAYRIIIWLSVVIHVGNNFVFPSVILLGECQPISKHWDVAGTQPGSCWGDKPKVISGYSGAATNILTDMIYTVAPLVYISRVQLRKATLWGVRTVFLLGLLTTAISTLKLYEMKSLNASSDATYTSVNLSIFAVSEVFVGAFTASLPPLRKTFETLLRRVPLDSAMGSATRSKKSISQKSMGKGIGNSYVMKEVGNSYVLNGKGIGRHARPKHDLDNDSEHSILEGKDAVGSITCTTEISVAGDDRRSVMDQGHDWV